MSREQITLAFRRAGYVPAVELGRVQAQLEAVTRTWEDQQDARAATGDEAAVEHARYVRRYTEMLLAQRNIVQWLNSEITTLERQLLDRNQSEAALSALHAAEVTRLTGERDEALASRDRLHTELSESRRQLKLAQANNRQRNIELDALHYVWCSGTCEGGVHRFGSGALTAGHVAAAMNNTARMVQKYTALAGSADSDGPVEVRMPMWEKARARVTNALTDQLEYATDQLESDLAASRAEVERLKVTPPTRLLFERIRLAWEKRPEVRLGQLLCNALLPNSGSPTAPLYYVDDGALVATVEAYANQNSSGPSGAGFGNEPGYADQGGESGASGCSATDPGLASVPVTPEVSDETSPPELSGNPGELPEPPAERAILVGSVWRNLRTWARITLLSPVAPEEVAEFRERHEWICDPPAAGEKELEE